MNIANIEPGMRTLRKGLKSTRVPCGILAVFMSTAVFAQQSVDTVVTNGKILTVDANFGVVEALAINGGRIVARGTSAEMARYTGRNTKIIDVKGATVIPGLIDNHFHFTRAVERWHQQARFEGVNSRREALRILAAKAGSLKPGDWIMVQGGWTPRQFADRPGGFTLEATDIFTEGLAIPCLKLVHRGEKRRDVIAIVRPGCSSPLPTRVSRPAPPDS